MQKLGLLEPEDFKDLTDEELHDVKMESVVGSNYWIWADEEQKRRDRLRQQEQQQQKKRWKFADIPHPIQIALMVLGLIIAAWSLWFAYSRGKTSEQPNGRKELGNLLAEGIKITDVCGYLPPHPPMLPDLAARVTKWHDDVLHALATNVSGEYLKQWQDAIIRTSPEAIDSNGAQCALVGFKTDTLRD